MLALIFFHVGLYFLHHGILPAACEILYDKSLQSVGRMIMNALKLSIIFETCGITMNVLKDMISCSLVQICRRLRRILHLG